MTITYRYGGGLSHNVNSNTLRSIQSINVNTDTSGLNSSLVASTRASIAVNNNIPATGGKDSESIIEVKNNTLASANIDK